MRWASLKPGDVVGNRAEDALLLVGIQPLPGGLLRLTGLCLTTGRLHSFEAEAQHDPCLPLLPAGTPPETGQDEARARGQAAGRPAEGEGSRR